MGRRTRLLMQNLGKNADSSSPDLPLQQDHEVRAEIDSHQNKITKKEGVRADCSESTKLAMESYVLKVRGNTNTSVPLDEIPNPTIRGDKSISAISKSTVLEEISAWMRSYYSESEKEQNKHAIAVAAGTSAWMRSYYSESEKEHNKHAIAVAAAIAAAADTAVMEAQAAITVARKALRALKGLVKLQGDIVLQELLTDIAAEICLSQIHELVEQPDAEFQVWCDNGYPRLVQRPLEIALTGKMTRRCSCFTEEELNQPGLEVYN
ncbi:hypothetical protein GIB67_042117 [Kingdonia uniflora]|uniref:Uncharacterized protein n=1 Tax=Kingdonia uniflora TaxID=39325 RepID=A0A7J7NP38_9MAGN|nr:hypothetical protein GIB67_042117 [Kingdonia uniflora]